MSIISNTAATVTLNSDGKKAIRVVVTSPAADEQAGPSDISLSNLNVEEGLSSGTLVGTISITSGVPPFVITINQDLGNAFQIVGNELQTSRALDFDVEPILNVGLLVTDSNNKTYTENFNINVIEAGGFNNTNSYVFNGNSYIIFNSTQFQLGLNHSINFWYRTKQTTSTQVFIGSRNGTNNSGLRVSMLPTTNANKIRMWFTTSDNRTKDYRYNFPSGYNENQWHMVTVVRSNDTMTLYFDGQPQTPASTPTDDIITNRFPNNAVFYLGSNGTGLAEYLTGKMDEISYHTVTLNGSQIITMYNNRSATDLFQTITDANYRNWYRADNDNLPQIIDVKNGLNGSSVNVTKTTLAPRGFNNVYSTNFDGVTNYFSGSGAITLTQPKTISFWVKRTNTSSIDRVYSTSQFLSDFASFNIYFDNNATNRILLKSVGSTGGAGQYEVRGVVGNLGDWTHIAFTMPASNLNANNVTLFVNGVNTTLSNISNNQNTLQTLPANIAFGAGTSGDEKFLGNIDEFGIFDIQCNSTQIAELYNLGMSPNLNTVSFQSSLRQWWRFGDENNRNAIMLDIRNENQVVMNNYNQSFYVSDVP